jgi:hypothetical protein
VPDDERDLEAAIERLLDLAAALAEGGWFGEPHDKETLRAATMPDPDERIAAVRALLAEEARMGMMVGVAVGWALKEELATTDRINPSQPGGES